MKKKEKNQNNFISGKNSCISILCNSRRNVFEIFIQEEKYNDFIKIIPLKYKNIITKVHKNKLDKYSNHQSHQGIVVSCSDQIPINDKMEEVICSNKIKRILMLEEIQDPHNIGAIIRTAYCMNFDAIFLSKNTPKINNTIVRTSAGYSECIDIYYVSSFSNLIVNLKKNQHTIIGLDIEGNSIQSHDSSIINNLKLKKTSIILGSEGKGMKHGTKKLCDELLRIKMKKNAESLNVSNAAAIIMYEFSKI